MKRKLLIALLTIVLIAGVFGALTIAASAETAAPEMNIAYCNISFQDSVCIKYAVKSNTSDVKILIWNTPEAEYLIGTQDDEITAYYDENINKVPHMVFDYTKLAAKQMTDVVYARAYAKVDGVDYYSEVNKYSILQYAYNKLGKTATASTNAEFKEMLANMLSYGASAQKYFDYKEDRLATADWYQVQVTGGALTGGGTQGLYLPGDKVTLIAPETDANGEAFSHWEDSNGNQVSTKSTYELTVGTANETYTPVYNHTVVLDPALAPTCSKMGLTEGYHCSGCGKVFVAQEIIPATGEHTFGEWITTKEATTAEEGLMERSCDCGAKETQTIDKLPVELEYTLYADGESYYVTGIGTWTDPELVIPATYKGLPVKSIGKWAFHNCKTLKSVTISDGVTLIGDRAFNLCSGLTNVLIPDSVTSVGSWAFNGCSNLLQTENGVSYVDKWAVDCETSVSTVILRDDTVGIGGDAFSGSGVLVGGPSLTSLVIPNGVKYICDYAFYNCDKLTEVYIGGQVNRIGRCAFYACDSLTKVTIDDAVTATIGISAFGACTSLTSVTIGDGVTGIRDGAFGSCYNLASVTIGNSVTFIGEAAFYACRDLTSIAIPDSVASIGDRAFEDCYNLTSMIIGKGVTSIGEYAFPYAALSVYYGGTSYDWNNIAIGEQFSNYRIYYYSKIQPTDTYTYWHYVDGVPTAW